MRVLKTKLLHQQAKRIATILRAGRYSSPEIALLKKRQTLVHKTDFRIGNWLRPA